MVWKQDLAQLKQQMKPDLPQASPTPKPVKPPQTSQSLEDADLIFLQAMGGVAVPPTPVSASPISVSGAVPAPRSLEPESDFSAVLGDLKGLRPLSQNPVFEAPSSAPLPTAALSAPPLVPAPALPLAPFSEAAPSPVRLESVIVRTELRETPKAAMAHPQEAPRLRSGPALIHLAAGMAVEVDGTLDLRRHSVNDARERLRERVGDGVSLQWRTLLVTLGPSEALKQGLLAFLTTPHAQFVSRYAQAPIPMGGAQAWILYLHREHTDEA